MKKLTITAASLMAALSVYAQGTVDFNNFSNPTGVANDRTGSAVALADGVVAQLYWSASMDGVYAAAGQPVMVGDAFGTPFPGYFGGGTVLLEGLSPAGGTAFFEVRAWEASFGSTFEQAAGTGGALRGISPRFMSDTGNPMATPPDLPGDLGALIPAFSVNVPEPSVIALGLLGAGALLMLRRRK